MDEFPRQMEEIITDQNGFTIYRLNVIGGWLIFIRDSTNAFSSTDFIADPNHQWTLES